MLDAIFLAATVSFVTVAILHVRGCERLRWKRPWSREAPHV